MTNDDTMSHSIIHAEYVDAARKGRFAERIAERVDTLFV